MTIRHNPFHKHLPTIDLHGETLDIAIFKINEFIEENIKLKQYQILIIHGIGEKILLHAVRNLKNSNPLIESFELDIYNDGITILNLTRKE